MKKTASNVADLQNRLRDAGLRSTAARIAVLQALQATANPITHAALANELVPKGFDKATVYRNLMDLNAAGLVSRSEFGDHVWRFELRPAGNEHGSSEHPHFLCVDCGEVSCLSQADFSISTSRNHSPIGRVTEILLKGHCGRCQG